MKTVTVDDVIAWSPCYLRDASKGEAYLRQLYSARERWTALDICRDMPPQGVQANDVLWTVLREELIPAQMLHELACRFAEHALNREREAGREPDPRSWRVIEVKRAWVAGKATDEELAAAGDASRAAARDAGAAAGDAAWAAARGAWAAAVAAEDAAWDAAWAAARDAARAAARAAGKAAWAAATEWQLSQVVEMLEKEVQSD